jgi:hypothetical protein
LCKFPDRRGAGAFLLSQGWCRVKTAAARRRHVIL